MANNPLTAQQDLLVREFYVEVAEKAEALLPNSPVFARQLRSICLLLLNYDQIASGAFITKGTVVQMPYGSQDFSAYPDEWAADFDAAVAAIAQGESDEAGYDTNTSEASASEPSTYSKVREALFPKDV